MVRLETDVLFRVGGFLWTSVTSIVSLLMTRTSRKGCLLFHSELVEVEVEVALRLMVSQSVCIGVEPTLQLVTRYYFLSEHCCLKVAVFFLWGALSDERTDLSRTEPVTILYCLRWDSPNLLYPPGTGWPSYTPRHWVPFTSPSTTCRAKLEVF
jgi:hypothetical protein